MAMKPLGIQYLIAIPGTITAVLFGKWLDKQVTLTMTRYRDKSSLYGGQLQPGDPPSWP